MAAKALPPQEVLRQLLDYCPNVGSFVWMSRPRSSFSYHPKMGADGAWRRWETLFAGKPAFTQTNAQGYRVARLHGVRHLAHRIAWMFVYGEEPDFIDHINGDRSDNRIYNLRSVDRLDNARNRALTHRNKTGVSGVYSREMRGKTFWISKAPDSTKAFLSYDDAVAHRREAELRLGFHENHGRLT